jgi:hypothetical protein
MVEEAEQYQFALHCETRDTSLGTSEDFNAYAQAVQGFAAIGDFTLDFIPASIVYCPPGQDMTASLTQSESYGTRFTVGESTGFKTDTTVQAKIDFLGIIGEGVGFSNSQSVQNGQTSGIQVSHFRNTVVTADNQRAIGRAYWGPLGDLFVILVNPNFAVSRRADGTLFYSMNSIAQVVVIPAWKLLRPGEDPIANAIPDDVRRRLLELDPFIGNLDQFFPDSGAALADAALPYNDPSPNNRAEAIGRWWLDTGSELAYSQGETHELFSTQTNQVSFESTVSINASVGINYDGIAAALGTAQSNTTTVGFQSSKETDASFSRSAACLLIHNQNERDLDGIDLYFDKIFSTFMFRRVRARRRGPRDVVVDHGALQGKIYSKRDGAPLVGSGVRLISEDGEVHETSTSARGGYSFVNLQPGMYALEVGTHREELGIDEESSPYNPHELTIRDVQPVIDLRHAPVWQVQQALGIPSEVVRRIGEQIDKATSSAALARIAGVDRATVEEWREHVELRLPRRQRGAAARNRRASTERGTGAED